MKLTIQWHITELCNLRCKHCYHDGYTEYWPSLEKLKEIFNEAIWLRRSYYWKIDFININFVWWEPFARKDFLDILEYINDRVQIMRIWILTNGTLLDEKIMKKLLSFTHLNIFFQLSIEGTQEINDEIRWFWTFDKIGKSIQLIRKSWFVVELSFTLTNNNKDNIIMLFPFVKEYDIKLKIRRFIPMWQGKNDTKLLLSSKEFYYLSKKIYLLWWVYFKDSKYWKVGFNWCSEMLSYNYKWFWCGINDHRILIILENLDVMACRKLDIVLWNLKDRSLEELYFDEKYIDMIHAHEKIDICKKCDKYDSCKWGAKCVSYAVNWSYDTIDPQCYKWELLTKKLWT